MVQLIRLDDPDDPAIGAFRDIRERDLTMREGRFIAEGTVVLNVLAQVAGAGAFAAEMILVLENRLAGLRDLLARFPEETPVYVASRPVIDAIAGFPMHRGVLALGRRVSTPSADAILALLPESALVLVGQGISNHDNMGALMRNAAVFGADAALFDGTSCDPLYRKAIRVSVGGVLKVPFARTGAISTLAALLAAEGFEVWGLSPRGEVAIERIGPIAGRRVALMVGTEGEGLPADLLDRVRTARIAQAPGMDSLNVATAAAIALHAVAGAMGRIG